MVDSMQPVIRIPRLRRSPIVVGAIIASLLSVTAGSAATEGAAWAAGSDVAAAGTAGVAAGPPAPSPAPASGRQTVHLEPMVDAGRATTRSMAVGQAAGGAGLDRTPAGPSSGRLRWQRPTTKGALGDPGATGGAADAGTPGVAHGATVAGVPDPVASAPDPAVVVATEADRTGAEPLELAAAGGPGVVGPAWSGLTDQAIPCGSSRPCVEPADPWIAVSSTHVVQAVSQAVRITTRTGTEPRTISNRTFFDVPAWSSTAFVEYPRVLFDPGRGRWIATLFAGTCSGGALFVAVSETADPTGAWDRSYLPFAGRWPSYPTLGSSSALVAVGVNEFAVSCGAGGSSVVGRYLGASLHVLDWADLADGDATRTVASTDPDPAAFTYAPAAGLTAGNPLHAVVALDDGSTNRADLGYLAIDGTVAGSLAVGTPVNLAEAIGLAKLADPPTPVDAGGLIGVQANALDLRPTDAVWRDGRLLVASTDRCAVGSTTRPCGRITELVTQPGLGAPALRQDLHLAPTAGYTDTFVPGIGSSDDGTTWAVFSQAGAGRYVSTWARRQLPGETPGSWSPGVALVAAGRGPYGGTAGAGLNERWGDEVGVARDPADPSSVWQANQVASTGGGWETRVARLGDDTAPPSVTAARPVFVKGLTASSASVALELRWTTADPGSGVASIVLQRSIDGGSWASISGLSASATSVVVRAAYGRRYAFRIMASDNAGNASGWAEGTPFTPAIVSEGSSAISYAGTWSTGRSSVYWGGRTRYASVARRRATLTFTGLAVAWVASVGPIRGAARVSGDGTLQGTYDTHRSSTAHRRIITGRTFGAVGRHTFRIEVVGTRGHGRVDVDGFIILR